METLTGDEANPFVQLVLIALVISGLVIFLKKGQRKRKSVWDDDDVPMIEAPMEAPSFGSFSTEETESSVEDGKIEPVPLPDDGLPEGWSEEQWLHYGHQYLGMQESEDGQDEK